MESLEHQGHKDSAATSCLDVAQVPVSSPIACIEYSGEIHRGESVEILWRLAPHTP